MRRKALIIKPQGRPTSEINVTPLVDVVLVLLIIFMVLTPLLEKVMSVRVPEETEVELTEVPPNQLVVHVGKTGELRVNSVPVPVEQFQEHLHDLIIKKAAGDRLVFFLSDEDSSYAVFVHAIDMARLAGAELIGMMTQPMASAPAPTPAPQ